MKPSDIPEVGVIVGDEPVSIFPVWFYGPAFTEDLEKFTGKNMSTVLCEFKKGEMKFCTSLEEWQEQGRIVFQKIQKEKDYFQDIYNKVVHYTEKMVKAAEKSHFQDLSKKSGKELLEIYNEFGKYMRLSVSSGVVFSFIDAKTGFLTDKLLGYLKTRIPEKDVPKYFTTLSTPLNKNFIQMERESLLLLALKIQQKIKTSKKTVPKELLKQIENSLELKKMFEKHFQKFFWVPYNYEGPTWTREDICKFLLDHLNDEKLIKTQLENFYERKKHVEKRQKEYTEKVKPEKEFEFLFKVSRDIVHLKGYRKDMLYKAYCYMEKLLKEVSKRIYISLQETRCLTPEETKNALLNEIVDQKRLRERVKYNVTVAFKKEYAVFEEETAKKFAAKIKEEEVKSMSELKGSCACHGEGKGIVKIINTTEEMKKMEEGDILVSKQTHPGLVPAMKKAAAIVTDSGGITCHAAIVSRELKIPCVIGTKVATKVLKDGDLVEVNASKGIVKKL